MARITAPAATLRFTVAEMARPTSASSTHHNANPTKRDRASHQFSVVHDHSLRLDLIAKMKSAGIQVSIESSGNNTVSFPAMYSRRENGRQKNNCSAPLETSQDIRLGLMKAISRNDNTP